MREIALGIDVRRQGMKTTPALWAAEAEKAAAVGNPTFADKLDAAGFSPEDVAGLEPLLEAEASARAVGLAIGQGDGISPDPS